jgi:hypothetical protein
LVKKFKIKRSKNKSTFIDYFIMILILLGLLFYSYSTDDPECEMCMVINWRIRWLLSNNYSPQQISKEVEKFCERYNSNFSHMCKVEANYQFSHYSTAIDERYNEQESCYNLNNRCPRTINPSSIHKQNLETELSNAANYLQSASVAIRNLARQLNLNEDGLIHL